MKIPKKVKIGSLTYAVNKTEKLTLGCDYSGEILYTELIINIRPSAPARMEADFLHECVHGMLESMGYKEHEEKKVDEFAHALHSFILDNPEIFKGRVEE